MISILLAATAIAPLTKTWEVVDGVYDGAQTCGISQVYADGTRFLIAVDERDAARNQFSLLASNEDWSIAEGERLGDISILTETKTFGSMARSGPGLFIIGSFLDRMSEALRAAASSGFTIRITERKKEIGPYSPIGLPAAVDKLEACLKRRFPKPDDPFAR